MSNAAAETAAMAAGAVNPETQAEVAATVKPRGAKKKKSWRARKREIEAQKAADAAPAAPRSVQQAAKLQKVKPAKAKKPGRPRRKAGRVPAELVGLVARRAALVAQLAGLEEAIKVSTAALRAAKS